MQTASPSRPSITMPRPGANLRVATAGALAVTVGLSIVCWVVTVQRMRGMDMGVTTRLGSFGGFLSLWVPMMAAMMLPGTVAATLRLVHTGGRTLELPRYVGSYIMVWAVFGVIVFAFYRPHGTMAAAALTVAAGVYELTPMKRHFRRMGQERVGSGLRLGLCCVGSTIGLMALMMALGAMSLTWMAVIAALALTQKILPPKAIPDVAVALAIVALGIAIIVAPSSIPGLVPAALTMPSM